MNSLRAKQTQFNLNAAGSADPGGASHFLSGRKGAPQKATLAADTPKRKQASRTPNASRLMTSRSMSELQCLKEQPSLAAAFGVREACFRFAMKPLNWPTSHRFAAAKVQKMRY